MARRPTSQRAVSAPSFVLKNPAVLAGLASPKTFDPQTIGEEFYAVPAENRNSRGIWEVYRNNPRSATYAQLEKDPKAALERVQIDQIRMMQAAIFIEREGDEPVRAFASFAVLEGGKRTYSTEPEIISDVQLQIRLLTNIRKDMADFERRYHDVAWLTPMARAISERATQRIADLETDLGLPEPPPTPQPRRGGRRPAP